MKYLPEAKTSVKAYPGLYNTYPNYNGVINSNSRLCPLTARSNRTPVFLIWKKYSGGEKKEGGWKQEEKQSPTCHIWDLGTCPAQVTRSRWYPWQVDGWITEHPVNQRPWKRVTQRAPLALSRSRIKMLDDRTAWITSRLKNMERKKEAFSNLSTDAHRTKTASVLFFISLSPLSLFLFLFLSPSVFERSFSRKVDSRLAKVAVSRWIICELNFLSVQVSEVSIDELLEHVASDNVGLEGVARIQKLKLYEFR